MQVRGAVIYSPKIIDNVNLGGVMHVPDRAYGIETEYAAVLERDAKVVDYKKWPSEFLKNHLYNRSDRSMCVIAGFAQVWHRNASLTYIDTGDHPEHASPEVRSIHDAVPGHRAFSLKLPGDDSDPVMPAAAFRAFMPCVLAAFVNDF